MHENKQKSHKRLFKSLSKNAWKHIWDDYSQLGATRLVGYLASHIQRAQYQDATVSATKKDTFIWFTLGAWHNFKGAEWSVLVAMARKHVAYSALADYSSTNAQQN